MSNAIDLDRLEFSVTYRCNSDCRHCYASDISRVPPAIDGALAAAYVRNVAATYDITSVMTFGGEPLLYPDVVCSIHDAANKSGISTRQLITNAGVPRDHGRAQAVAQQLAGCGVNNIYVSVDAFHQEFVPIGIVERNVGYYLDAGIPLVKWNPCWVLSEDSDNPYNNDTREILAALAGLKIDVGGGNVVQPNGRAARNLAPYLPPKSPIPPGSCADVPYGTTLDHITCMLLEPNGDVTICPEWPIGNAYDENILSVLERYDPDQIPEARAILDGGTTALAALCQTRGVDPDESGYYSICDMCASLRRR